MKDKGFSEKSFLIICIVLGAVQIWIGRNTLGSDGVSYLDAGDAFFRHDWARAINGYWSPLYSICTGLALYLFKPSIWREVNTVQAVNFVIYLAALFSFRFFLHSLLGANRDTDPLIESDSTPLPELLMMGLGYSIFLWSAIVLADISYITPDLLVETFLLLLGGYLVQLRNRESYAKFALFGVLCGFAYLAKAVMFPVGFCLVAILLFSGKFSTRRISGVLLAGSLFIAVGAPFIAALSRQKGRLTFGDSGRLNYAFMVSPGVQQKNWQGEPPEGGVPKHTTRQILDRPPVFEFAQPTGGTYPPWFDPSYWDEGAHPTFRLKAQVRVLVQSGRDYLKMLLPQLGLLAGIGIFMLWGRGATRKAVLSNWPLIVAACLIIGLYSVVLVRSRYVAGAFVFLFMAVLAGIRLPKNTQTSIISNYVAIATTATILFSVLAFLAEAAYLANTVYDYPMPNDEINAAAALQNMGLHAGDPVANIGDGVIQYWARLGKFRIVAEVFSPGAGKLEFWSESWDRRKMAYDALARTGAKVVVVWSPPIGVDPGWQKVGNTHYYVRFLTK
jgi:hypothetical protein